MEENFFFFFNGNQEKIFLITQKNEFIVYSKGPMFGRGAVE